MKHYHFMLFLSIPLLWAFSGARKACEYAGSNIQFAKEQTELALGEDNINKAKYFAYKALNAIENTKGQLRECGCEKAEFSFIKSLENLKQATRSKELNKAKKLIWEALSFAEEGIEALQAYKDGNVVPEKTHTTSKERSKTYFLHTEIDKSLEAYKKSLDEIVRSVDCGGALEFAERVYNHSEKQLLKPNLSEGKRYYNLRVKEITG
ncbi:MAG: hypothetical protein AB3N16_00475, partial [Flavobacteriaceae bacterium]